MSYEYTVLEVNVARLTAHKIPEDVNQRLDELGQRGWDLVQVQPIVNMGWFGGSYTSSLVLFLRRTRATSPS